MARITVQSGAETLSVEVTGEGPLVILAHGWPELGLSWRHQAPALAAAGWRVAVPDMRGYGASDKPEAPEAYTLNTLADDLDAIATALGAARYVVVGHDWGSIVVWRTALKHPTRVAAVCGMSVPHAPPPPVPFLDIIDALYPDRFFYIRYIQPLGVAEAEMAAHLRDGLRGVYYSGSGVGVRNHVSRHTPRDATLLQSWDQPPPGPLHFIPDDVFDQYVAAFAAGGWRGPFNYYRNFPRNAEDARALGDSVIRQPSAFFYGEHDVVLAFVPNQLETQRRLLADLRAETMFPGMGHWLQQEAPAAVNAALLEFLDGIRSIV